MKIKVSPQQIVEGERVEFKTLKEEWNTYQLLDGTIVKVKTIATDIFKLESIDEFTGQHHYFVKHNTIVSMMEPRKRE